MYLQTTELSNMQSSQTPIAIIGMAGIFPQASNLQEYWENILGGVDCITDVPSSRWDIEEYYDPNPKTPDKTYCRKGGFIPDIAFNPIEFGLPPNILEVTDITQLLSLLVAKQALKDANYDKCDASIRQRTGVVVGVCTGQQLITPLTTRLQYPIWEKVLKSRGLSDRETQEIIENIKLAYVRWEENSFPGLLGNVVAGRIANRLDLGGMNCIVDAACASSLGAVRMAISELNENRSDLMITGGVDLDNSIFAYMCFSKTPAFSQQQQTRPFDIASDGMLPGEGIGMLVLKRWEDARRDGDRIYAVIRGIGSSSDGKGKSIYAPSANGQTLALRRAYEMAGIDPASISLIEAHGTGTPAGDPTEVAGLKAVFSQNRSTQQHIALGSVKSQIGHTKSAAGAASLIKVALALHHKVLPPTINVTQPNPKLELEDSPFYLNTETRPWLCDADLPRRAGVSAFGFGGTNFHVVLEESTAEQAQAYRIHETPASILLYAPTPEQLLERCQTVCSQLNADTAKQTYRELMTSSQLIIPRLAARVGFVAQSLTEAQNFLEIAIARLKAHLCDDSWEDPQGIYYRKTGIDPQGKVVALFSGQGSQFLEMGKEAVINFPQMRQAYSEMDRNLVAKGYLPISPIVFPPPVFNADQKKAQSFQLQQTENAQAALAAFHVGMYRILQQAGFKANFVAGHSFGELSALWAAGVVKDEDYFQLVKERGQAMAAPARSGFDSGKMLAVKGDPQAIAEIVKNFSDVYIANWNANNQVVLAGTSAAINQIQKQLEEQGYQGILLSVSAAFHTPLVNHAQQPFAEALKTTRFHSPQIPVYSNVTAKPYSNNPLEIEQTLANHILNPVRFKEEIENIYQAGGNIFVEFSPRQVLTNLVTNILGDRPHIAIALNQGQSRRESDRGKDSDRQLREAVMQLRVVGLPLHHFDPYSLLPNKNDIQHQKEGIIYLNGNNYVSEKTKTAFAEALQQNNLVKLPAKSSVFQHPDSQESIQQNGKVNFEITDSSQNNQIHASSIDRENLPTSSNKKPIPTKLTFKEHQQMLPEPTSQNPQQQHQAALNEYMKRFQEHQTQLLESHRQFWQYQYEYTQQFFQFMQQQNSQPSSEKVTVSSGPSFPEITSRQTEPTPTEAIALTPQPQQQIMYPVGVTESSVVEKNGKATQINSKTDTSISEPKDNIQTGIGNSTEYEPVKHIAPNTGLETHQSPHVSVSPYSRVIDEAPPTVTTQTKAQTETKEVTLPLEDLERLSQSLIKIISDKTGYPTDMLNLDMELEADLGIDSIKRVEIFGEIQELFPDVPLLNPEELSELKNLKEIVDYLGKQPNLTEKKTVNQF